MAGFQLSEHINRSPEEVFAYVTDLSKALEWLPAVTGLEPISEGPMQVGTRYQETRRVGDMEGQTEIEVTHYNPPVSYATIFKRGGYHSTYCYTFKIEGVGTRVELKCVVVGLGIKKLFAPIIARAMRRFDQGQLVSLRKSIDRG